MEIGIIGSGNIGGTLARLFASVGHGVAISNRRGPASLTDLVHSVGQACRAVTPDEAVLTSDVTVIAVPWSARETLPSSDVFAGKMVIDACNPYIGAGQVENLGGQPSSGVLRNQLQPQALVKAFNTIFYRDLAENGKTLSPRIERQVIFVSGDDGEAKNIAENLIEDIGFAAYDLGSLEASRPSQEPGGCFYNKRLTLRALDPE